MSDRGLLESTSSRQAIFKRTKLRTVISYSPTLYAALQQLCKWASLEDTNLYMWLERCDDRVRICSKLGGTAGMLHLEHSQWLQNVFVVHIVRQFAGSEWTPSTMAFEANYAPGSEARAFWPNARFLPYQEASWIDVPVAHLDLPSLTHNKVLNLSEDEPQPFGDELVRALKLMLPSYLDEGIPAVAKIAEMAGTSVRSFQRKLSNVGLTYSSLLELIRFENAAKLLRETDAKIIEIAFSSGYADPAHFSRAFRRISALRRANFGRNGDRSRHSPRLAFVLHSSPFRLVRRQFSSAQARYGQRATSNSGLHIRRSGGGA
ncbi:helix-turn-helix transcriptional regulator [Bradyrhizobium uaiense]|uniref:Helix-turn-helix transcriptional regulator n=1 Tax=Bradyrhizobium uaiense TaxID=2594946 RepID=A0A6P1BCA1_9BRAD|nr:helix-turn-helix transcriptional regulator [Bradyrhizobium uaiense]NEU96038.1 helix-turn-helix transcriptional regulator [Bradyrhizobium uaiense]